MKLILAVVLALLIASLRGNAADALNDDPKRIKAEAQASALLSSDTLAKG